MSPDDAVPRWLADEIAQREAAQADADARNAAIAAVLGSWDSASSDDKDAALKTIVQAHLVASAPDLVADLPDDAMATVAVAAAEPAQPGIKPVAAPVSPLA